MLSILIPTYNYNVYPLVCQLEEQAIEANITFEIICFDDNSKTFKDHNQLMVESLPHVRIINSKKNIGRIHARQKLSDESIFDWLLFLDADVIPKNKSFIQIYTNQISPENDAIFGGLTYSKKKPKNDFMLRWKYGKTYESINADKRNSNPYQVIVSGNFFIKKKVFNLINSKIDKVGYGLDNHFAALLKQNNIKVIHINNEVYHYGIEKSEVYLDKAEACIITLLGLLNEKKMFEHDNKLLSIFMFFKKFKLNYPMLLLYKVFNKKMKKNLIGANPNMYIFQFYKLAYICYKDLN